MAICIQYAGVCYVDSASFQAGVVARLTSLNLTPVQLTVNADNSFDAWLKDATANPPYMVHFGPYASLSSPPAVSVTLAPVSVTPFTPAPPVWPPVAAAPALVDKTALSAGYTGFVDTIHDVVGVSWLPFAIVLAVLLSPFIVKKLLKKAQS